MGLKPNALDHANIIANNFNQQSKDNLFQKVIVDESCTFTLEEQLEMDSA